ncbi:hypothetical protein FRC02_009762 [Tulasnella sp. 418]|nr:hypothetical protein FRC02_009762 [Tulasnella sp. 418]
MSLLRPFTRSIRSNLSQRSSIRSLHASSPVLKKKSKSAVEHDEDEFIPEDDLFGSVTSEPAHSSKGGASSPSAIAAAAKKAESINQMREQLFDDYRSTVIYRLEGIKDKRRPDPRLGSIDLLLRVVDSQTQLEAVTDVLQKWRNAKMTIPKQTGENFLGRCTSLKRPDVALKVLSERSKYGVDLTSLSTARSILRAIHSRAISQDESAKPFTDSWLNDALLLAGLTPHYGLGELQSDPASRELLIRIAKKAGEEGQAAEVVIELQNLRTQTV